MTPTHLQQWIQHPETLNRDTLYELRTLVARYPYFQSLRLLYLKNLYLLHDINFGAELRKAVLYVADRRVLFYFIEGDRYTLKSRKVSSLFSGDLEKEPSVDRTLSLIDAFLATVPEEHSQHTELDYAVDYTAYLMQEEPGVDAEDESEVPKLRGHELIDDFIQKSESSDASDTRREFLVEKEEETEEEEEPSVSPVTEELDDSCFTETLAKIYIKQHRYDKALEIIKKLSLNYPKKNAYFADQIRFLEKLIINAKLLLVILMLIASVLMCFIVLIQNSKGGGLASGFSSSNQIMGVRKTTDFLEKATWTLAAVMVVFSIVSAYTIPSSTGKGGDVILEQAQQEEKTNPYNMPVGTEAPQSEAPAATTPAEAPAPAAE